MKHKTNRDKAGFTRIELIVVIVAIAFVGTLLALSLAPRPHGRSSGSISCASILREAGTAYRLWSDDNGNRNPYEQTVANGGWKDLLTNADQGANCWTNYAIMQNELGQAPKLVICPKDKRVAAASFTSNFDNTHISYFVGVSANDNYPQSILGGDRNLGPGPKPDPDYGFSPKSGKGNDVAIPLNSSNSAFAWSLKMHSIYVDNTSDGAGNILLADGSAQLVSSAAFNRDWLPNAAGTNNWPAGHIPATPSIRLVFP